LFIDDSNSDKQRSSSDSGFVFYLVPIKADEETKKQDEGIARYFGIVCDQLSNVS
jgi:hypothetical protein